MRNHARTGKHTTTEEMALAMDLTPFTNEYEAVEEILEKYRSENREFILLLALIFNLGYVKGKQDERARKKAVRSGNF